MASYLTAHLHNASPGADAVLEESFRGAHMDGIKRLRGFRGAQRFELAPEQLMASIPQPWRYVTIYDFEFEDPNIDLPAIAPYVASLRDAGLIANDDAERLYSYRMYSPWVFGSNYRPGPLSHIMMVLANMTPGRTDEYHRWYDGQHRGEVIGTPGYVGLRRGQLSEVQAPPVRYCPGDQLVLAGLQTDDLANSIKEYFERGSYISTTVKWGPRSSAASTARTVHMFKSAAGPFEAAA